MHGQMDRVKMLGDKNSLFGGRSVGDFAFCVKDEVEASPGSPPIYLESRLMKRTPLEVGVVDLGPYVREKDDSWLKKGYTTPLNFSPHLNSAESGIRRGGPPGKSRLRRANLKRLEVNMRTFPKDTTEQYGGKVAKAEREFSESVGWAHPYGSAAPITKADIYLD